MSSPISQPVLDKVPVDIDFTKGLDEIWSVEQLPANKALKVADNVSFDTPGVIRARPGITTLASTDEDSTALGPIFRMLPAESGPAFIGDSWRLYQYDDASSVIRKKNLLPEFSLETTLMGAGAKTNSLVDAFPTGAGLTSRYKVVLANNNSSSYYQSSLTFADRDSGNIVRRYLIASPTVTALQVASMCVVDDRYVHVYMGLYAGASVQLYVFDEQSLPATLPGFYAPSVPAQVVGCVAYTGGSAVLMSNGYVAKFPAAGGSELATGQATGFVTVGGIDVGDSSGGTFYVSGVNATPKRVLKVLNGTTLATTRTVTSTAVDVATTDYVRVARGVVGADTAYCYLLTYRYDSTNFGVCDVEICDGNDTDFTRIQSLASWSENSLPFYCAASGRFYVALGKLLWGSTDTASGFDDVFGSVALVDLTSLTWFNLPPKSFRVACTLDGFADVSHTGYVTSQVPIRPHVSGDLIAHVGLVKSTFGSLANEFRLLRLYDSSGATLDRDVISGGTVTSYDGLQAAELGWLDSPSVHAEGSGAGTLAAGNYGYAVVYEFKDMAGKSHYSRTSRVITVTTVGAEDIGLKITMPTVTCHTNTHQSANTMYFQGAVVHIFRTVSGGTTYYLHSSKQADAVGTPNYVLSVTDSTTDAVLETKTLMYRQPGTFGTALDRYAPRSSRHILRLKDRVFTCRNNDIFYSSFFVDGEAEWFNPNFRINVPGGPITGLARMDGLLVAFKESSVHVIDGDGPAENGGNGTEYSPPRQLQAEFGCIDPRTIVNTPQGVMYMSRRGIELLSRDLKVSYIGERVLRTLEDYPYPAGSCFDHQTGRAMWFLGASQGDHQGQIEGSCRTIVYDIGTDTWSTYTQASVGGETTVIQDGCYSSLSDGKRVFLARNSTAAGTCYLAKEDHSAFIDTIGSTKVLIPIHLETGYFRGPSIQDLIRITNFYVSGSNREEKPFAVDVFYAEDYSEDYQAVASWDSAILSDYKYIQLNAKPTRELVKSMSFKVVTKAGTDTPVTGEQIEIFGLSCRMAVNSAAPRLAGELTGSMEV